MPEFKRKALRRVAFDWATRRKLLAGRTLWMLEPTLVLMEGRVDLKVRAARGQFRAGKRLLMGLHWTANRSSTAVLAAGTHSRIGVPSHVGAQDWPRPYELSKNLHR